MLERYLTDPDYRRLCRLVFSEPERFPLVRQTLELAESPHELDHACHADSGSGDRGSVRDVDPGPGDARILPDRGGRDHRPDRGLAGRARGWDGRSAAGDPWPLTI